MKYYEKRRHLVTKIIVVAIVGIALFFALCDCTPKATQQQVTITYEKE